LPSIRSRRNSKLIVYELLQVLSCHFGPFKTPARETDPRHLPPNFYYDQEDFLISQSRGKTWSWSALRPDLLAYRRIHGDDHQQVHGVSFAWPHDEVATQADPLTSER
jgi:hypothetical protein